MCCPQFYFFSCLGKHTDFLVLGEGIGRSKGIGYLGLGMGIGILDIFDLVNRFSN